MVVNDIAIPGEGVYCRNHHMEGNCEEVPLGEKRVEEAAEDSCRRNSIEDVTDAIRDSISSNTDRSNSKILSARHHRPRSSERALTPSSR